MKVSAQAQNILLMGGAGLAVYFVATRVLAADVAAVARDVGQAVNPLNNDNVFARGADAVTRAVSGDPGTSLGSMIFDWFNPPYDPNAPSGEVGSDTPENIYNDRVRLDPGFNFPPI